MMFRRTRKPKQRNGVVADPLRVVSWVTEGPPWHHCNTTPPTPPPPVDVVHNTGRPQ